MLEFYMIFARKMPDFYMIIAQYFAIFFGGGAVGGGRGRHVPPRARRLLHLCL